jgi:hypothetical protein
MVTQADKTNTGVVATIVVVGAFAMISISALLTAMVRSEEADVDAVRPTHADLDTIAALDKQQNDGLHAAPHWSDKEARRVSIPIENAMKLVVSELKKDPKLASPPVPPGVVLPPAPPPVGAEAGGAAPVGAEASGAAPGAPGAAPFSAGLPAATPNAPAAPPGAAAPGGSPAAPAPPPAGAAPAPPRGSNAAPPTGAAPGAAPGPAAPATPPVPPARKL